MFCNLDIYIEMKFDADADVYPHALAYNPQNCSTSQHLLSPSNEYLFTRNKSHAKLHVNSAPQNLVSAELYGRMFDRDVLPYSCNELSHRCQHQTTETPIILNCYFQSLAHVLAFVLVPAFCRSPCRLVIRMFM